MDAVDSRLAAARAAAVALLADLESDLAAIAATTADSPDDEHDAEGSTVGYERARVAALLAQARRSLDEIEAALARSREGTYGRCVACGEVVSDERLDALPTTTLCIACAGRTSPA